MKKSIPVIDDHPFKSNEPDNSVIEIPVRNFRSSGKPDKFKFSRDSKKRWVRKSKGFKKKDSR